MLSGECCLVEGEIPYKLDSLTVSIFQPVSKKNLRLCILIFLVNNFSIMVGNGVG